VEIQTIKNPILKKSIDRDKILLYGREDMGDSAKAHSDLKQEVLNPIQEQHNIQ
jgi:tRNA(Leu) C34 or U34 (ribose-2'-O)-methylase TrmL